MSKKITTERALGDIQSVFKNYLNKNKYIVNDDVEIKYISTGYPILDLMLGGEGLPLGRTVQFVGRTGSGKSALAAGILGNVQRMYKNQCYLAYFDAENTTTELRLRQLGVEQPKGIIVTDFTLEDFFKAIEGIIKLKKDQPELKEIPCILVLDSVPATRVEKTKEVDATEKTTGLRAKVSSFWFEKLTAEMAKNNITIIAINQVRDNIQMGYITKAGDMKALGTDKALPGGKSWKYYSFDLLNLADKSLKKSDWGFGGNSVILETWKCKSFTPYLKIPMYFSFTEGFSECWSMYPALVEGKYIKSGGGSYFKYYLKEDGTPKKFVKKNINKLWKEDEAFRVALRRLFEDYKKDFIKQYREVFEAFEKHDMLKEIEKDGESDKNVKKNTTKKTLKKKNKKKDSETKTTKKTVKSQESVEHDELLSDDGDFVLDDL